MPKVSVLMGTFNCAATVEKSIYSIQEQTFSDWEMIVCDDGSSDRTKEIILAMAKSDPRIKFYENDRNRGLSYTLNHCLRHATGEFCARMDGDDLCDPTRFEKQVAFLEAHPEYGFVSTTMKRFDEKGVYQDPPKGDVHEPKMWDYIKGSPFCHAPVMIRKACYDAVNGYRDLPQTQQVEDYDLWFRLKAKGVRGCTLNEPLYSMFDGRDAAQRRSFRRRQNEAWVRKEGYRAIGAPAIAYLFVLKPILLGLLPQKVYRLLFRR